MTSASSVDRPILVVTKNDFRAERDGGSKRTAAVVRAMEATGTRVEFIAVRPFVASAGATPLRPTVVDALSAARTFLRIMVTLSLSSLKWFSWTSAMAVSAARRSGQFRGTVVGFSQLAKYGLIAPQPTALDMHNIESELLANYADSGPNALRRRLADHEARSMRRIERRLSDQFALIATVSQHDLEYLASLRGNEDRIQDHTVVAANGVSDDCFAWEGDRSRSVVFIAHLGWRPNIDAAVFLARKVWPLVTSADPTLDLKIVGRSPGPEVLDLAGPTVSIVPDVPSPLPYVGGALVATAPLLASGGTRLKILEALAVGTPLVSTKLGALGLETLENSWFAIADEPEEFAAEVIRLSRLSIDRDTVRSAAEAYRWTTTLTDFIDRFIFMTLTSGRR